MSTRPWADLFTQTGTFVAVPLEDPSLPSYTGKVTIWGGFNANGTTVNGTFTFNLSATGSDGSTINTHQVDHFNVRPDGTVNEFTALARIDTPEELVAYRNGGILPYVLRQLVAS